jgi:hypothetical protein
VADEADVLSANAIGVAVQDNSDFRQHLAHIPAIRPSAERMVHIPAHEAMNPPRRRHFHEHPIEQLVPLPVVR